MARKKLETLSEQMYYILLSLYAGPMHGYRIMRHAAQLTQGRVVIGAGTEEGRKSYELTPSGRQLLENEFQRLRRQVADGAPFLDKGEEK